MKYTAKEMETLLRVAPHMSFAHVIQLLSVPDKEAREKIGTKLGAGRWTVGQLRHAIQAKLGTRRKGGRPVKLPARPQDGLQEMLDAVIAPQTLSLPRRRRWSAWRNEAAKPNRSTKSRAAIALLEKLDYEAREFSHAIRATAGSKSDRRAFA